MYIIYYICIYYIIYVYNILYVYIILYMYTLYYICMYQSICILYYIHICLCIYYIIYVYIIYNICILFSNFCSSKWSQPSQPKWSLLQDGTGGDHLPRSMRSSEPRCVPAWPLPSGGALMRRCTALDPWSVTPFLGGSGDIHHSSPEISEIFTWWPWAFVLQHAVILFVDCLRHLQCGIPGEPTAAGDEELWSSRVSSPTRKGFVTQHLQTANSKDSKGKAEQGPKTDHNGCVATIPVFWLTDLRNKLHFIILIHSHGSTRGWLY